MSSSARRAYFMMLGEAVVAPFFIVGDFPDAFIGVPYDETLDIVGSYTPPVVIDAIEGVSAIPAGLTLAIDSTGTKARLHGTPLADIAISGDLPGAVIGSAYSARLQVANAVGVVTVDVSAGEMPAWMFITWHSDTQEIEFHGMPV